jgi:iron complex outermembrane receptor protein
MAGFTRDGLNGADSWNHRNAYLNKADVVLNTSFSDHISMHLAFDYVYNRDISELGLLTFPGTTNRYNPYTGVLTPNYTWALDSITNQYISTYSPYVSDIHNIARSSTLTYGWNQAAAVQNDWAANYKFGGISSTTIAGWSFLHTQTRSLSKTGALPNFDLTNPDAGDGVYPIYTGILTTSTISQTQQEQFYALERFGFFDDRIYLSGGVSHLVVDSATTNLLSTASAAVLDGNHNTTNFGFLGKPIENASVYYNYSGNSVPTTFNNRPIWQEGKQHEFGVKSEFFNRRLAISIARFQITQTNVSIPNPEYQLDKTQPQNLLYDLRNVGQEIEITGSITKQLNVVASAALMHTRDKFGRRPRAIADRQAALLVNYHFNNASLKGLAVYFGASYTGDAEGDAPPSATVLGVIAQSSFKVSGYTKCSAGATYKWANYTLRLSGDNVFNAKYLYSPGARFAVAESPMPNVTVSLSIHL